MIYLLVFAISLLLLFLASKCTKSLKRILIFISLLLPCLLAGLRADTVGTDVSVYLKPMSQLAVKSDSFSSFLDGWWQQPLDVRYVKDIEIGFTMLVFCVMKVFNNIYVLQFIIQALIILPIYYGLKKSLKFEHIWIGMLVFYCMFYNISLNIMRQMIAISFMFLAFQYIFKNRSIPKYLIFQIVACLFHNVAILGFLIALLYFFINMPSIFSYKKSKIIVFRIALISMISLFVLLFNNVVAELLSKIGLGYYSRYIAGTIQFLPNQVISRVVLLILPVFVIKNIDVKEYGYYAFLYLCVILTIIVAEFSSIRGESYRISFCFSIFSINYLSEFMKVSTSKLKKTSLISLICFYMVFWWVFYTILNADSSIPYEFYFM